MNADSLVLDFIQDLEQRRTADDVGDAFSRLLSNYGFTQFLAGRLTPNKVRQDRGEVWASTGQSDWFTVLFKKHYRQDPGSDRARAQQCPFLWSDLQAEYEARHVRFLHELRECGIVDGVASSFKTEGDEVVGITIGTPEHDIDAGMINSLVLASIYFGSKLARLHNRRTPVSTALSARERECLHWVASGKTDWDISEIIGISQQTVHKHVSNALKKLNASTRAHAVAIALSERILQL